MTTKFILTPEGKRYIIDASHDAIRCDCGAMVPEGQMCTRCPRRTLGPSVEAPLTRIRRGEGTWQMTLRQNRSGKSSPTAQA